MSDNTTPNTKNQPEKSKKPHGLTRQRILEIAFSQLRKKRAETDPEILEKIRNKVFNNPAIMKKLGVGNESAERPVVSEPTEAKRNIPEQKAVPDKSVANKPMSEDEKNLRAHVDQIVKKHRANEKNKNTDKPDRSKTHEVIDKKKTLETIAKLMKIRPDYKEKQ